MPPTRSSHCASAELWARKSPAVGADRRQQVWTAPGNVVEKRVAQGSGFDRATESWQRGFQKCPPGLPRREPDAPPWRVLLLLCSAVEGKSFLPAAEANDLPAGCSL